MNHLKSRTLIFIIIIFTGAANAQDNSLKHDEILKIDLYLVKRSLVCLDDTDYPTCKSISIEDLDDKLTGKRSYNIEIPPKEIYYTNEKYKNLFYDITRFMDEYQNKEYQLEYNRRSSILLIIQNDYSADEKISIKRSSCKTLFDEPINEYASSPEFTLRKNERWFNHQNALFFHPAYKCKFEIKSENQDKTWVLHFIK